MSDRLALSLTQPAPLLRNFRAKVETKLGEIDRFSSPPHPVPRPLSGLVGPCEHFRLRRGGTCTCLLPGQLVDKVLRGIRSGSDRELRRVKLTLESALDWRR